MPKKQKLLDEYQFPGFRPKSKIKGIFGDPYARIIQLVIPNVIKKDTIEEN